MTFGEHIKARRELYLLILVWVASGAFLPQIAAITISVVSFILVLRTKDSLAILIALIAMLVFSDSRAAIFGFAETAKIGCIVLSVIYVVLNLREFEPSSLTIFRFFLPFVLFSMVASVWANVPFTAFQKSISYGAIMLVAPVFYLHGRKENKHAGPELVYFFSLILGMGVVLYFLAPSFATLVGRYRGLLGNPNGLGIFSTVLFAIFYPVYKQQRAQFASKWYLVGFVLVFLFGVIMTGSRTALIAILLFFIFNRLRVFTNIVSILLFIVLIASYEYLLLKLPEFIMFFGLEEYFRLDTLEEGSGRFVAWKFAWERIQEVFFLGGGFGHTEYVFKLYQDELSRLGHQGNAHNSYLTIWLDTGLIGIVLFFTGLLRTILVGVKNYSYTLPLVFAVLFSTYFESWLSGSLNPFTGLFIISLTILSVPFNQEERVSNE